MRFVLYVSRLPRNLLQLFVERVFLSANGLVCDAPEGRIAYKTRFAGFMRLSRKSFRPQGYKMPLWRAAIWETQERQEQANEAAAEPLTEFARRRHEAIKAQMLYGGMR